MNIENLCPRCMRRLKDPAARFCPMCGKDMTAKVPVEHQLKPFSVLKDRYLIGEVIGQGGFGITYIGLDMTLEVRVAVKELYPDRFCRRDSAVTDRMTVYDQKYKESVLKWQEDFLSEARRLGKCSELPGVVGVRDFFYGNDTAYIVLEYLEGMDLKTYTKSQGGKLPARILLPAIRPVIEALEKVHEQGLIHRDISPDNIRCLQNGEMKLMDFGAARDYLGDDEKSLSILLKKGYAPEEQYYSKGKQGPWTDVYALAATIYKCLTGVTPPESMGRIREDDLKRPGELGVELPSYIENALLRAMSVYAEDRYQSMKEFYEVLYPAADQMTGDTAFRTPPPGQFGQDPATGPASGPWPGMRTGQPSGPYAGRQPGPDPVSYPGVRTGQSSGSYPGTRPGSVSASGTGSRTGPDPGAGAPVSAKKAPKRKGGPVAAGLLCLLLLCGGAGGFFLIRSMSGQSEEMPGAESQSIFAENGGEKGPASKDAENPEESRGTEEVGEEEEMTEGGSETSEAADAGSGNESGGFLYRELSEDSVAVVGYTGSERELVIPDRLDGKKVEVLQKLETDDVKYLTIPGSVIAVGEDAVISSSIRKITLRDGIERLNDGAFSECEKLEEINLPKSIDYIGMDVFSRNFVEKQKETRGIYYLDGIALAIKAEEQEFKWKDNTRGISGDFWKMFHGSQELEVKYLEIPDSVIFIGKGAFRCVHAAEIYVPGNVKNIGKYAIGCDADKDPYGDVMIIAPSGSAATEYAEKNGIYYVKY